MIKTINLDVGYGKKKVIEGVELKALKGQVISILGPNGAGKSTILRTIAGLLAPLEGQVYIGERDIRTIHQSELAKKLSIILTEKISGGYMTAFDVVSLGRYPYTGFFGRLSKKDIVLIREALLMVNAENLINRLYDELSDGEKQKVLIARAIVQEPEVIVLDEPTSHLDIKHKIEVVSILRKLSMDRGITVICSIHDVDMALKYSSVVLLVKDGKILCCGAPEEVIEEDTINSLYDIKDGGYENLLGSYEMRARGEKSVFVTGGAGTGIPVYRAMAKNGYLVNSGIIHENDVDYFVGRTICSKLVCEKAFCRISELAVNRAISEIEDSCCVIDSGFPIGWANEGNRKLMEYAVSKGKRVVSVRKEEEILRYFGEDAKKIICFDSVKQMADYISRHE